MTIEQLKFEFWATVRDAQQEEDERKEAELLEYAHELEQQLYEEMAVEAVEECFLGTEVTLSKEEDPFYEG